MIKYNVSKQGWNCGRDVMNQKGLRFQSWVSEQIMINNSNDRVGLVKKDKWILVYSVFEGPTFFLDSGMSCHIFTTQYLVYTILMEDIKIN